MHSIALYFPKNMKRAGAWILNLLISLLFYFCIVDGVSLSHSSLPNEGFVQIVTKYSGTKSVCWQSLKNSADDVVCRQMGYIRKDSLVKQPAPLSAKDKIFSGSINCNGGEKYLSRCSTNSSTKGCSELSYIKCELLKRLIRIYHYISYHTRDRLEQQV